LRKDEVYQNLKNANSVRSKKKQAWFADVFVDKTERLKKLFHVSHKLWRRKRKQSALERSMHTTFNNFTSLTVISWREATSLKVA